MIVLRDGTWLLPYWSEHPRGDRIAMSVNGNGNGAPPEAGDLAGPRKLGAAAAAAEAQGYTVRRQSEQAAAAAGMEERSGVAAITSAGARGLRGFWSGARFRSWESSSGGFGFRGRGGGTGDKEEERQGKQEPFDINACHAPVTPKGAIPELFGNKTYAGVLRSTDRGASWQAHGRLSDPRTDLIEGVAMELSDRVLMMFRTKIGCVFASASTDGGRSWSRAAPLNVPNSNTKFDAIVLAPYSNTILMALNNMRRG
jgi:hypothetical protein